MVKYVNSQAGPIRDHVFVALNLSRFFLDWARPYEDEKMKSRSYAISYRMDRFMSFATPECVAETRISTTSQNSIGVSTALDVHIDHLLDSPRPIRGRFKAKWSGPRSSMHEQHD